MMICLTNGTCRNVLCYPTQRSLGPFLVEPREPLHSCTSPLSNTTLAIIVLASQTWCSCYMKDMTCEHRGGGVTKGSSSCGHLQAGFVAYLEGQLHGGALEEGKQTYPGYLVLLTSGVGLLLTSKAQEGGLLSTAAAGFLNTIYTAKLTLLVLPQVPSFVIMLGSLKSLSCCQAAYLDLVTGRCLVDHVPAWLADSLSVMLLR